MPTRRAEPAVWTTRRLLAWITGAFEEKGIDSARLCAEMLLAHVIGCERLRLYMDQDRPASPLEREALRDLVARGLRHEPIQYLVGEAWFFGMPFGVDRRVLIPRPATETIVETVLQHARSNPGFGGHRESDFGDGVLIADVCTGSGCMAVALAKRMPGARCVATDIDAGALEVAGENAERHGVADRVDLLEGDLLGALSEHPVARAAGSVHYLVSNPPYIPDDEWEAVEPNVKDHEPTRALRGGRDGLDFVRPLIEGAGRVLRPGGLMLIEVAAARAGEAAGLARSQASLDRVQVLKDFEGLDRVVSARRRG